MGSGMQSYRGDIDGLRAVAVLAVLLFHVGVPVFKGGYVGVDVFFVISGFLITGMLAGELSKTGNINLGRFLLRRAMRLLPAFIAVAAGSFAIGVFLLSPEALQALSRSTIAATFAVSNILFWNESGYFDAASSAKPLLHTWTLSVEWQFYLVWPLLILLVGKIAGVKRLPWLVVATAIVSFALNAYVFEVRPNINDAEVARDAYASATQAAFFLTPFRAFEFAIGGLLALLPRLSLRSPRLANVGLLAGLGFICWTVFTLDEGAPFPYFNALMPCVGAALVIASGARASWAPILSNGFARWIGELSYSIYLVHWPIIVFYQYVTGNDLDLVEQAGLVVASTAVAWLLFTFIEVPFRHRKNAKPILSARWFGAALLASVVAISVPATSAAGTGWAWRIPEDIRNALQIAREQRQAVITAWDQMREETSGDTPFSDEETKILVIGDSMARDVVMALSSVVDTGRIDVRRYAVNHQCGFLFGNRVELADYPFGESAAGGCNEAMNSVLSGNLISEADIVVVAMRWYDWQPSTSIEQAMEVLKEKTRGELVMVGPKVEFEPTVPDLLLAHGTTFAFAETLYTTGKQRAVNDRIRSIANGIGARFIDMADIQCSGKQCDSFSGEGRLLYWDWGHWTLEGMPIFGSRLLQSIQRQAEPAV